MIDAEQVVAASRTFMIDAELGGLAS